MFGEPLVAAALIFALFALGEVVSILSKARIPMLFIVVFGYLMLLWSGIFPENILEKAHLAGFATIIPAPLIVHLGTIIPFQQIKEQYKAVLIALSGVVLATVLVILIGLPIIGYTNAVAGIGPLTGGIIAFIITSEKLQEIGLASLVTIPALVLAIQKVVGIPLAARFLRKYGYKVRSQLENESHENQETEADNADVAGNEQEVRALLPKKYRTQIVLLFQVFLGGAIAVTLDNFTGINYSLWALAIGLTGSYFGIYQGNMMDRANSMGISMALVIIVVMQSMDDVTPGMFTTYLPHALLIMVIGIAGIIIGGYFSSKYLKWDRDKGIPVALTALFGFPADYILCEEVSRSIGRNEREQKRIFNSILTPMLIGGFTTVTIASIVVASILVSTL